MFAAIAKRIAGKDISLKSIIQHANCAVSTAQKTVTLVTYKTTEAAVHKAVDDVTKYGYLTNRLQIIRIEHAG